MSAWLDASVALGPALPTYPGDRPFELCSMKRMRRGDPLNLSAVSMSAHAGTHIDAPRHFVRGGAAIEELALDLFFGPCEVLEVSDPLRVGAPELRRKLGRRRPPRLLLKTANSRRGLMRRRRFARDFVYLTPDAARWLAGRGLRLIGIDYLSIERFGSAAPETHTALLGAGIPIVEGLDLGAARSGRWELACAPLKVSGGDGAPARAVLRRLS